jgi:hypothetical protein
VAGKCSDLNNYHSIIAIDHSSPMEPFKLTPQQWKAVGICALYAGASMTISMIYKAILSEYQFPASFLLLTAQCLVALTFCLLAMHVFPPMPLLQLKPFNMGTFQA